MIKESLKLVLIVTSINFTFTLHLQAQENNHRVNVLGEMRKVMWEGELDGVINLDTIRTKENVYGLGPVECLTGEILIIDGVSYVSTVTSDSTMKVDESYSVKAPRLLGLAYLANRAWQGLRTSPTAPGKLRVPRQLRLVGLEYLANRD